MVFSEIGEISRITLSGEFFFDNLSVVDISLNSYINEGISEIHVYHGDIKNFESIEKFFSIYLKALYTKLFDGEPEADLMNAFENVTSKYEVDLLRLSEADLRKEVTVYGTADQHAEIFSSIGATSDIYCCRGDRSIGQFTS